MTQRPIRWQRSLAGETQDLAPSPHLSIHIQARAPRLVKGLDAQSHRQRQRVRSDATLKTSQIIKYIWAAPVSAVGAGFALLAIIIGAQVRVKAGVLEVSLRPKIPRLANVFTSLPFSAITFGHVVLAATEMEQEVFRSHERVHVAQYERWGVLFLLLYPAESALQFFLGRHPYQDNRFEISARLISDQSTIFASRGAAAPKSSSA